MAKNSRKRKIVARVLGIIAISIVAIFLLAIGINSAITKNNKSKIENAYGEFYETSSGKINYTVIGEGDNTIVMLPGHGSISPHFEFISLANRLANENKVIIIEPLGYGLSDDTDVVRSAENICNEIHEVLSYLGEDEYFLMGHSISGLYMLKYSNMFESEVLGVIGLDASVPAQLGENVSSKSFLLDAYRVVFVNTGLIRLSMLGIEDAPAEIFDTPAVQGSILQNFKNISKEERTVLAELYSTRAQNKTMIKEISMFDENAKNEMTMTFPSSIPVLYILSGDNVNKDSNWKEYHEELADNNSYSLVTVVEGNHYVHLAAEDEVFNISSDWIRNYAA
ncbi:MAG: alpha/beta hydrolase [Clostridia bacterium]|nr:alpha/beta hydrolase [Clostridia bacterium]